MCIVVIPELESNELCILRVKHPVYPGCERLRTMSKDEMISAFCEHSTYWGDHQFTPCLTFASIIDVYRDTMTCDKLIFPSAITRILCHFSIPFPSSDHFFIMCAINYATVKQSEA